MLDPQRSSYLSFGLLLFRCVLSTDFGTSMPSMSAEESIPSLDGRSTTNQNWGLLQRIGILVQGEIVVPWERLSIQKGAAPFGGKLW